MAPQLGGLFLMLERKIVSTKLAPAPKGPYSQGVIAGDFVFVAGQGPVDPQSGRLILGDIRSECELTLKNIEAIIAASGAKLADVTRCTVYLRDLQDFGAMNEVYQRYFSHNPPARTTIGASNLLGDIKVEIDAVAFLPDKKRSHARNHRSVRRERRSKR
jgi:2-iminobutanoate/2-iminopropanoate deaminase